MMTNVSEELARLAKLRDEGVLSQAEFDKQKATVLAGSEADTAKPKGTMKKAGLGCLGLVVLLLVIGLIVGESPKGGTGGADVPKAAQPPVAVTAAELARAYDANEAAAQQKYGNRPLAVSGTVAGIDLDMTDDPTVKLRTDNEFMPAQATLVDADKPKAASLSKGAAIKLLCQSVGEVLSTPMLRDCAIQ